MIYFCEIKVIEAKEVVHGRLFPISHDSTGLFSSLPQNFKAVRYHSLIVSESDMPSCLKVNAWTGNENSRIIMGLQHKEKPLYGVQFHPEVSLKF